MSKMINGIDVNYAYYIQYVKEVIGDKSLKVLDFGCGNGEMVNLLRQQGIDCYGADIFYEGASFDKVKKDNLFKEGIIREIPPNGSLPFPENFFDLIIANQVFEHIDNKELVLNNLDKILKKDGIIYAHFPSQECLWEGHIGIPLLHWFPKGRTRFIYTIIMRAIGFGYYKNELSFYEFANEKLDWIDKYCFYEKYEDLKRKIELKYNISHREIDYSRFRASDNRLLSFLLSVKPMKELYQIIFRRLAFMAIELKKISNEQSHCC